MIYFCYFADCGYPGTGMSLPLTASCHRQTEAFETLEPEGTKWHWTKWIGILGSYLLMMFYTTVAGWMLYYCFRNIRGDFAGAGTKEVEAGFSQMLARAGDGLWTFILIAAGFGICWFGIQIGIEKVSKVMMSVLFLIMIVLAVRSVFLEGAGEGVRFYLIPDFQKNGEIGIGNVIFGAMGARHFSHCLSVSAP